jgi:hypothetical protein
MQHLLMQFLQMQPITNQDVVLMMTPIGPQQVLQNDQTQFQSGQAYFPNTHMGHLINPEIAAMLQQQAGRPRPIEAQATKLRTQIGVGFFRCLHFSAVLSYVSMSAFISPMVVLVHAHVHAKQTGSRVAMPVRLHVRF